MVREINYYKIRNVHYETPIPKGRDLEGGFLGDAGVKISPKELESIKEPFTVLKFIEVIKRHQPKEWNPADPKPKMANDLHFLVFKELKERKLTGDDISNVRFYTALGSILDKKFNTDCFFEYFDVELGFFVYLTVDIKAASSEDLRSGRVKESKAGYVLNIDSAMIEATKSEQQEILKDKAAEIAERFNEIRERIKLQRDQKG